MSQTLNYYEMLMMPVFNATALYLYDTMIERKSSQAALTDSIIIASSTLGTKVIDDLLISKFVSDGQEGQTISEMAVKPVVNLFLYPMLYKQFYEPRFQDQTTYIRPQMQQYYVGAIAGLSQNYLKNPLLSLILGITTI